MPTTDTLQHLHELQADSKKLHFMLGALLGSISEHPHASAAIQTTLNRKHGNATTHNERQWIQALINATQIDAPAPQQPEPSNVIPFPIADTGCWRTFKAEVATLLINRGLSTESAIAFLAEFEPTYKIFSFEHPLTLSIRDDELAPELVRTLRAHEQTLKLHLLNLLTDRFNRELRLYLARDNNGL